MQATRGRIPRYSRSQLFLRPATLVEFSAKSLSSSDLQMPQTAWPFIHFIHGMHNGEYAEQRQLGRKYLKPRQPIRTPPAGEQGANGSHQRDAPRAAIVGPRGGKVEQPRGEGRKNEGGRMR